MTTENNIVNFTPKKALTIPLDKLDSFEGIKMMARMLRQWERESNEHTFKNFAKMVGLYPTTIARLASEDTKAPRLHTILMIMKGLGFNAVRFE